jgi:hypothetical protein
VSFYQKRQPDASRCKDLQINEHIRRLNNPMDRLALAHPQLRVIHNNTITMFLRCCTGRLVLSGDRVVTVETKAIIN